MNVIFDASVLTNHFNKNSLRSGIFFVAWNVFNQLRKRTDISLCLYFDSVHLAEGFLFKCKVAPDVDYVQNLEKYSLLCRLNLWCWSVHKKIYKHRFLRLPFAFGVLITQKALAFFAEKDFTPKVITESDVFLSPAFSIPEIIRRYDRIKTFLVLHDAIPFLYPELNNADWFLRNVVESARPDDFFFCVSKNTQKDFMKLFPNVTEHNSRVTFLAADERLCRSNKNVVELLKNKYGIPSGKKYVFSLCTLEPRKNLIRAVRSFVRFVEKNNIENLIWVMGGSAWKTFFDELNRQNVSWNSDLICRIGYVDDCDLPALYSNAEWFVYTSQYEGFGLPPLEAMQCGCPVIVSNNSSLPEVVGDAGLLIDWDSDEQHIAAYEKYYFDEKSRMENSRKGLERAKLFSWEKTADQMINVMTGA